MNGNVKDKDVIRKTPIDGQTPQNSRLSALLSVGDVARALNCSPRHVYRLADSGRIPKPVKLGSLVRWSPKMLDEWIAAGCPTHFQGHAGGIGKG